MTPKILLVDDEPHNLDTFEAFLQGEGYHLLFADNGADACALALVEQPDLILLDVMMPEMDGFSVTRRIREDPVIGRVPIILVTALDDHASRLRGLTAGADDFLTKPCRREEIRARVRTVASLNRFRTIAEQRERFQRLFEVAPNAIVLVDANGLVVSANAEGRIHPVGREIFSSFDPSSITPLRQMVADALAGRRPGAQELRQGQGEQQKIYQVRAASVPEGDAHLVILILDDVTAEVQTREELKKLNLELDDRVSARTLELQEANALLMSYANFVSHDLRSPLTVVKGYLSMLQEDVAQVAPELAPMVDKAFSGAIMMQELVDNILRLAQEEHDRPQETSACSVDPTLVVRRVATRMRELFPSPTPRIEIAALPRVGVSAVLIERVFYNLLANALKYSAQRAEPHVEVGASSANGNPVIYVRDNGVGFDREDADKLFRQFSRLSTAEGCEGLGLGLSLVARLLRAHGGRIWAEGAVGVGATFFVELPAPAAPAAPDAESVSATLPA